MDGYGTNKKYGPMKIPGRQQALEDGANQSLPRLKTNSPAARPDDMYYEIDYDSCPIPGVGKFVLRPQKIKEPEKDEIRDLFGQMRDIARAHRATYDFSRFFDRRVHHDNGAVFYKQGMFMQGFSDDFPGNVQFSQYFPYYQMMGYEQLRTYFTWRTQVRKGDVANTSLSYAFLYIYELLCNIGAESPQDGLDKLMSFWHAFSVHNNAVDKYVSRWLKDYHIYYELPQPFQEFVKNNHLTEHYPAMADTVDNFDLFCAISKYDIRKSAFFTDDSANMIKDCFYFVMDRLKQVFLQNGICFDESVFKPEKKMIPWMPFRDALFYQWKEQPDRRIVLSESEIYICSQNKWTFSTVITGENGRQLIGYIMKQMEAVLRKVTGYKFKLSANIDTATHETARKLEEAGLPLERIVSGAAMEFYREATKTVVRVDLGALTAIRREALVTQAKLIVPEQNDPLAPILAQHLPSEAPPGMMALEPEALLSKAPPDTAALEPPPEHLPLEAPPLPAGAPESGRDFMAGPWECLKGVLTEIEKKALGLALHGEAEINEIKKLADGAGVMLEVLVDRINEKAMDCIGDNLMDEDLVLYDDYKEQVKELIG